MPKSKIWVRRLTHPPSSGADTAEPIGQQEDGEEDNRVALGHEQMSRITNIALLAGEGTYPRPHVHGVEPSWGMKFWASGEDEDSSSGSEDEDDSSPTLTKEAIIRDPQGMF
jgi:hypothetical protein